MERHGLPVLRWLGLLLLLLATTLAVAGAAWQIWYVGRIFPGVAVAGVPLSGHTPGTALALLRARDVHAVRNPVLVTRQEAIRVLPHRYELSAAALGQLVNEAYALGRSGSPGQDLAMRWRLLHQGYNIVPEPSPAAADIAGFDGAGAAEIFPAPQDAVGPARIPPQADSARNTETRQRQIGQIVVQETSLPTVSGPISPHVPAAEIFPPAGPLREPLVVAHAELDLQFALDVRSLAAATVDPAAHLYDPVAIRSQVQRWAGLVDTAPVNARVRFNAIDRALEVVQPSRRGVILDVAGTVEAILAALQAEDSAAVLQVKWLSPEFTQENLSSLGIRSLVGRSETYFKGSSAARVHNIELTTRQFSSVLIAPGEVFSFNDTIGPITVAAGDADAAVIWGDRTAIGVGGGVCQVSTAIFRSALHAGLPIEERHNHGYVVSWYGQPGMDATIYTPLVDLKFRNDTAAHLLLQPDLDVEQGTLAVNLFGTPTGRLVNITEPVISRVTEPESPVFVEDRSLAPGETRLLESEKLGLTVVVHRNITENGLTRSERFVSVYQPWRAVYAEGPVLAAEVDGVLDAAPVP